MPTVVLNGYSPKETLQFPVKIRFHKELTPGEKLFYAEIAAMQSGSCLFCSRKLSQFFGVSHQTILNWVNKLISFDLIEVKYDYKNTDCKQFLVVKEVK